MMQNDEGTQEKIEVLTTKKETPKTKSSVKKERSTKRRKKSKKKTQKGWKNKKIPTEGFSKGDEVQLIYQQLGTSQQANECYTVCKILSLEHAEIEHQGTKRKLTVRGDKLRHYSHQPP